MIAKVITGGQDRDEALRSLDLALSELLVSIVYLGIFVIYLLRFQVLVQIFNLFSDFYESIASRNRKSTRTSLKYEIDIVKLMTIKYFSYIRSNYLIPPNLLLTLFSWLLV